MFFLFYLLPALVCLFFALLEIYKDHCVLKNPLNYKSIIFEVGICFLPVVNWFILIDDILEIKKVPIG